MNAHESSLRWAVDAQDGVMGRLCMLVVDEAGRAELERLSAALNHRPASRAEHAGRLGEGAAGLRDVLEALQGHRGVARAVGQVEWSDADR